MLGLSYKKNVSDLRNSYVIKLAELIKKNSLKLDIYDPLISSLKVKKLNIINKLKLDKYDIIINAVNHDIFKDKILTIKKSKIKLY